MIRYKEIRFLIKLPIKENLRELGGGGLWKIKSRDMTTKVKLAQYNKPTVSGVRPPIPMCLGYDSKLHLMTRLQFWSFVQYPFIAITPRPTLTQSGSTCKSPINGSNRTNHFTVCKQISDFKLNCWNHLTVCKRMSNVEQNY